MATHMRLFLKPNHADPPDLGLAIKLHTNALQHHCYAAAFLYHLLGHSDNAVGLANEMLKECLEIDQVREIAAEVYNKSDDELPNADDWVERMLFALPPPALQDDTGSVPSLNQLASHYLTHLCLAIWNPGGPATPQTTTHPSPDHPRNLNIQNLAEQAGTLHRTSSLKTLIELRDGLVCPVSGWSFDVNAGGVHSELAHILPFSIHKKTVTRQAIESFTGMQIDSASILHCMNLPENALMLQVDCHKSFDISFSWGIEAITGPYAEAFQTRYFIRAVKRNAIPLHAMGGRIDKELIFGQGAFGNEIALPNPHFCNLKLNIMRVLHMSGAAEVLQRFWRDYDSVSVGSSSLGVSQEMDDLFINKLALIGVF